MEKILTMIMNKKEKEMRRNALSGVGKGGGTIKLKRIFLNKKGELVNSEYCGKFKSYLAIGEWLANNGETGKYYATPSGITSIAGIKEINVVKYWDNEQERWAREIEMEGSCY